VKIAGYYDKNMAEHATWQDLEVKRMKWMDIRRKHALPDAASAQPGRVEGMPITDRHAVLGTPMRPPYAAHLEQALFGMGCFWGVERLFWQMSGVVTTAVGYAAGTTPNPTYKEVCTGQTGHNEVVSIVFDPNVLTYTALLKAFWENHDPTQGMRQGNDLGTQYRSGIYCFGEHQEVAARESLDAYQPQLISAGYRDITTEILPAPTFFFAEDYHQQYLHKNPAGYCGMGGTGVVCPIGTGVAAQGSTR
jgi:peptide-methionine (S)-S-oxide reductase